MAFIKYIIQEEDFILAVKYNTEKREVILGGKSRYSNYMIQLIQNYFEITLSNPQFVQNNKIKYTFPYQFNNFFKAVNLMQEAQINIYQTSSHLTIMR